MVAKENGFGEFGVAWDVRLEGGESADDAGLLHTARHWDGNWKGSGRGGSKGFEWCGRERSSKHYHYPFGEEC